MAPAQGREKMFGNLIESGSHKGDHARKGRFFLGALAVYALAFLAIGVGSIYAYNTHLDNLDLRVIALITPVDSSRAQAPQRSAASRPSAGSNNSPREIVVKTKPAIATMDPTLVTDKTPVSAHVPELPPGTNYSIGNPGPFGGNGDGTSGGGGGGNGSGNISSGVNDLVKDTPPPAMKTETSKPLEVKRIQSIGVVNGIATFLPKPAYTALAKAAHASGTVTVQVTIDESGKVISARALSGHPLLLRESVQAAYQARFTPTLLSNQPVKVSGIITYNFVLG
jgi:TonB family protein